MQRRHSMRGVTHTSNGFWRIYPLSIIFAFHTILVAYVQSTYMEQFVSPAGVGALFSIGSALAVIAFLFFTHALRITGNVLLTLILALIDIISLVVLGFADTAAVAITAFVLFLVVNPLIYLNIDIFSETIIGKDESSTGSKRGLALTLMSVAAVAAPIVMAVILEGSDDLSPVYFASAGFFSLFVIFILAQLRDFKDPNYEQLKVRTTIAELWRESDIRNVMLSHFTLQLFFTWSSIYIPLYLFTEIGLQWDAIGYVMAVALMAYVIFEWPIGIIADRWIGEKEIMALGFLLLAISVAYISFLDTTAILPWMVLMFITRIGAAMTESTTESYFFKHAQGDDAHAIGLFRLLRPLATIAGALLGSAALLYLPFNLIFVVLGIAMVPGIFFTVALRDTK